MPKAAEYQAELNSFLHGAKRRDKTRINWTEKADAEFEKLYVLQQAATLSHPFPGAPLALMTDASNNCVGAVLQQQQGDNSWKPLGYFSKRLTVAQRKYSTYDRELVAIYLAITHFRNLIEGRHLVICTDHKPLTYAFSKLGSTKETALRARQLLFISEFTSDIRHITGTDNIVADALSRVETIVCPTTIDYQELASRQDDCAELAKLFDAKGNLQLKRIMLPGCDKHVVCEMSGNTARPYLSISFRRLAYDSIHNLSHPGIRVTRKLVTDRFFLA